MPIKIPRNPKVGTRAAAMASIYHLTPREELVLAHMMAGHLNKQTAHSLMISIRTVEHYRAALMLKMGGHNMTDVMRIAEMQKTADDHELGSVAAAPSTPVPFALQWDEREQRAGKDLG